MLKSSGYWLMEFSSKVNSVNLSYGFEMGSWNAMCCGGAVYEWVLQQIGRKRDGLRKQVVFTNGYKS